MSCYVHIDAGACIDYTRIVRSVPCHTLCLELTLILSSLSPCMIVLKNVRNQWELSLICSIIAMQFLSRYRMPRQFFNPYFCDQSYVTVKHTSPLIMDAVQIGDRDSKTELLVIQHGSVRTCTFQCRSTSAKEVKMNFNNMPRFFKNGLYHCTLRCILL